MIDVVTTLHTHLCNHVVLEQGIPGSLQATGESLHSSHYPTLVRMSPWLEKTLHPQPASATRNLTPATSRLRPSRERILRDPAPVRSKTDSGVCEQGRRV